VKKKKNTAAQMGYSSELEATKKKTSLASSQWVSLISPTHYTLQKIYCRQNNNYYYDLCVHIIISDKYSIILQD